MLVDFTKMEGLRNDFIIIDRSTILLRSERAYVECPNNELELSTTVLGASKNVGRLS